MKPSTLSKTDFVAKFGAVYENSPQFAEAVHAAGVPDDFAALLEAFRSAVNYAGRDAILALIRAHPDLVTRAGLSRESAAEQKSAGLDQCTPAELKELQELTAAYKARFGFPFIMAVRGCTRAQILNSFRGRMELYEGVEFNLVLDQIHRIAAFRLRDILDGK